jgi:hypothetical protein
MYMQPTDLLASCKLVVLAKPGALTVDELQSWLTHDHVIIDLVGDLANVALHGKDASGPPRVVRLT